MGHVPAAAERHRHEGAAGCKQAAAAGVAGVALRVARVAVSGKRLALIV